MPRAPKGKRVVSADGAFTVSGKAANGEGSLYRERDGVWRATYRVPGESRPRRVRGRTREEALRRRGEALTKAMAEQARPTTLVTLSPSSTIAEFSAWWLKTVAAVRVRQSSLGKYEDRVERITAWLGDVRVGSLRVEQVATWQAELLKTLSPSTVADTRATFRSIMSEAVTLELIAANPNTLKLGCVDGDGGGLGGLGPVSVAEAFDVPADVFAFDQAGVRSSPPDRVEPLHDQGDRVSPPAVSRQRGENRVPLRSSGARCARP